MVVWIAVLLDDVAKVNPSVPTGKSFSGIFEITGLDTIRRLPEQRLTVAAQQVAAAQRYLDARPRRSAGEAEPGNEVRDKLKP